MAYSQIDMCDIESEFENVIEKVYEMVDKRKMNCFSHKCAYLEMGIIEAFGQEGFADFIADFNDAFEIISYHYGDATVKFGDVFVVFDYRCNGCTVFRAKVCESLEDAENYYRSLF